MNGPSNKLDEVIREFSGEELKKVDTNSGVEY